MKSKLAIIFIFLCISGCVPYPDIFQGFQSMHSVIKKNSQTNDETDSERDINKITKITIEYQEIIETKQREQNKEKTRRQK
jgi:NADH:ubiquinone oxidoreductase subunit B-like Fe-S oxidoreductase